MFSVLFDMDGVLVNSEIYALKAWRKCLAPQDLIPLWSLCLGITSEEEYKQFNYRLGWSFLQYQQFCSIIRRYMPDDIPFKSGALELVKSLKQHCKVAVVSSSSRQKIEQRLKDHVNLFDCIVSGDDVTQGKPSPEIYLQAMKTLNTTPENCWAIEDSPSGIESARQSGIHNLIYIEDTLPYSLEYTDVIVANCPLIELKSWIQRSDF